MVDIAVLGNVLGFNLVDIIILVAVGFSAVRGVKLGGAIQLGSYSGFWIGLIIGAIIAPPLASFFMPVILRTIVSLVILFGCASGLAALGRYVGTHAWRSLKRIHLGPLDSALGAGISVVATLLGAWIVAAVAVNAPYATISSQMANSRVVRALDAVLPPAPSIFSRFDRLIGSTGFPSVFASIPPTLAGPVSLPTSSIVQGVVAKVSASTVKVEGVGCGQIQEGSGFLVAPGVVVTNAHVVAGIASPVIIDHSGEHPASVVFFDPRFDLAILRASGLNEQPLTLAPQEVSRGQEAVVLGYPEGGPLTYGSAGVMAVFDAQGRDIYGQGLTNRQVYEIEAIVRPGNSGGPLVDLNGQVIGVVFSRSTTNPQIGFALASPGVISRVQQGESSNSHVSTGACIA